MRKILLLLSVMSCIESNGMNISQILDNKKSELDISIFNVQDSKAVDKKMSFARVISMEQLFQLILKIPQPEFVYSVMVDHIIPPPVGQNAVFEAISDMLPPLSIIDMDGCQWKVAVPSVERTWQDWGNIFMDVRHERFHLPLLKLMINDFLSERATNPHLGIEVKLQNVVNICKREPTLYSLKRRAEQCHNLERFEAILDKIDPRRIQAAQTEKGQSDKKPNTKVQIKKSSAVAILKDLYSVMRLDQVETENIEGFYVPNVVREWSKSERALHWKNWLDYFTKRADIVDLMNSKTIHPDEIAQRYYVPILQFLNIEINWAKHYELMPLLMNILSSYQEFVDYKNKPYPFMYKGQYDTKAPAYVALSDYISTLSEDLILRLSNIDFPEVLQSLSDQRLSVQSSSDIWLSWLENFSRRMKFKTLKNYHLPFIKFFASKMVKSDMFFGGGHTKFVTVLQSVIVDGIRNYNLDIFSRGYRYTDCRLLSLPAMIWDCCDKAESVISNAANGSNIYDILMFLDKILEISSKDLYLLGYNGDDLLKLCNPRDLTILKSEIKRVLWDSANPNCPQHRTYQTVQGRLIPQIRRKLEGAS